MNSPSSRHSSPSIPSEHNNCQETPTTHTLGTQQSSEHFSPDSPQTSPFTTQSAPSPDAQVTNVSKPPGPSIIVTEANPEATSQQQNRVASTPRQDRSPASWQRTAQSSSQSPRPSPNPNILQPGPEPQRTLIVAMSSAGSSPSTTTTASGTSGTTSGSNQGYHLPYAPFPYPMPGNARGGQGNQGSNSGNSGK